MSNNVVTYIYKRYCHIADTDLQIFHLVKFQCSNIYNTEVTQFKDIAKSIVNSKYSRESASFRVN